MEIKGGAFGRKIPDLNGFKPSPELVPTAGKGTGSEEVPVPREAAIARNAGFTTTTAKLQPLGAAPKPPKENMTQRGIRVRIEDWNRFQYFCNMRGWTHGEGLQYLMKDYPDPA